MISSQCCLIAGFEIWGGGGGGKSIYFEIWGGGGGVCGPPAPLVPPPMNHGHKPAAPVILQGHYKKWWKGRGRGIGSPYIFYVCAQLPLKIKTLAVLHTATLVVCL